MEFLGACAIVVPKNVESLLCGLLLFLLDERDEFIGLCNGARLIEKILQPKRKFEFWANDEEFYRVAAKTPRSNCVMDVSKMLGAGVKVRSVEEALADSLNNWKRAA